MLYDGEMMKMIANTNINSARMFGVNFNFYQKLSPKIDVNLNSSYVNGSSSDTLPLAHIPPLSIRGELNFKSNKKSEITFYTKYNAWKKVINKIPEHWNIIFTVSPVRYTKIGLIDNFLGKSILRLAIEKLLTLRKNSFYFPSYEIITDELRDYSFSEDNGTHPNQKAVAVVMDRFKEFLFI